MYSMVTIISKTLKVVKRVNLKFSSQEKKFAITLYDNKKQLDLSWWLFCSAYKKQIFTLYVWH